MAGKIVSATPNPQRVHSLLFRDLEVPLVVFQRLGVLAELQVRVADAAVQVGDDLGPVRDVVVRPVLHRLQRAFRLLQALLVLPRALRCDEANKGCLYIL